MEINRLGLRQALKFLSKKKIIVLIDTNFLIYIAKGLIAPSMILETLEYPYTIATTWPVVRELDLLSSTRSPTTARLARTARDRILPRLVNIIIDDNNKADDSLLLTALKLKGEGYHVIIATSDRILRSRARDSGIPTLYYRESEKSLELDWEPI